jgi:copper resistance protein C
MRRSLGSIHKWSAAMAISLVVMALWSTVAAAHETVVTESSPADGAILAASPAQVVARFSEELDTKESTIRVLDAAGKQFSDGNGKVDLDDPDHQSMIAVLPAPLPQGAYTVQWHAVLVDGDASDGTFTFTVRASPASSQQATTQTPTAVPTSMPAATATATVGAPSPATAQSTQKLQPATLPNTGSRAGRPVMWLLGALGMGGAVALGWTALRRRNTR